MLENDPLTGSDSSCGDIELPKIKAELAAAAAAAAAVAAAAESAELAAAKFRLAASWLEWIELGFGTSEVTSEEEVEMAEGWDPIKLAWKKINKTGVINDPLGQTNGHARTPEAITIFTLNWSTRPTTVPAGSDHYFHTECPTVRPSKNFKIKLKSLPAGSLGWPSGSLKSPVL